MNRTRLAVAKLVVSACVTMGLTASALTGCGPPKSARSAEATVTSIDRCAGSSRFSSETPVDVAVLLEMVGDDPVQDFLDSVVHEPPLGPPDFGLVQTVVPRYDEGVVFMNFYCQIPEHDRSIAMGQIEASPLVAELRRNVTPRSVLGS